MRNRLLQWIIVILIVVVGGWVVIQRYHDQPPNIKAGNRAPDFKLDTLSGRQISLHQLRGKGVLLNFWASYCGPCRSEMPALQQVYSQVKNKGVAFVGINTGETSTITISSFVKQTGAKFPIALDPNGTVVSLYKVVPIPESVFIDASGTIRAVELGAMDKATIVSEVQKIMPKS